MITIAFRKHHLLMCAGCINQAAFRTFRFRENALRLDAHNIWFNMCGCGQVVVQKTVFTTILWGV